MMGQMLWLSWHSLKNTVACFSSLNSCDGTKTQSIFFLSCRKCKVAPTRCLWSPAYIPRLFQPCNSAPQHRRWRRPVYWERRKDRTETKSERYEHVCCCSVGFSMGACEVTLMRRPEKKQNKLGFFSANIVCKSFVFNCQRVNNSRATKCRQCTGEDTTQHTWIIIIES